MRYGDWPCYLVNLKVDPPLLKGRYVCISLPTARKGVAFTLARRQLWRELGVTPRRIVYMQGRPYTPAQQRAKRRTMRAMSR